MGLAAGSDTTIGDLVNKDTDADGVPDWEEKLWGTDPTKKETTPGIPDNTAINKLKADQGTNDLAGSTDTTGTEKLTETDKFSRDLFATIAAATQDGQPLDQATVDKISSSLADHIKNSTPRKVYTLADLKVTKDDSVQAFKNYNNTWNAIHKKYPESVSAREVLQKFQGDGNNIDAEALIELDPIIARVNKIISELVNMNTPASLATLHLDVINTLQRLSENTSDVELYDTDPIVALSGMSQYNTNSDVLQTAIKNLGIAVDKKLGASQ